MRVRESLILILKRRKIKNPTLIGCPEVVIGRLVDHRGETSDHKINMFDIKPKIPATGLQFIFSQFFSFYTSKTIISPYYFD